MGYLGLVPGRIKGDNLVLRMFPDPLAHTQMADQLLAFVTENGRQLCLVIRTKSLFFRRTLIFRWLS